MAIDYSDDPEPEQLRGLTAAITADAFCEIGAALVAYESEYGCAGHA